jgi:hypothetical protein
MICFRTVIFLGRPAGLLQPQFRSLFYHLVQSSAKNNHAAARESAA